MARLGAFISQLWPENFLPKLRNVAARGNRLALRTNNRVRFGIWREFSKRIYGNLRPIALEEGELWVHSHDWRAFKIWNSKGGDSPLISAWRQLLELQPDLVIDIGANYGEFSIVAKDSGADVLAVEANPNLIQCLEKSFGHLPSLKVVNKAITDTDDPVTLYFDEEMSGFSSLSEAAASEHIPPTGRSKGTEAVELEGVTLSTLIAKESYSPRSLVFKLDIEGFEKEAMEGAGEFLSSLDWWRGIVEFSPPLLHRRGLNPQDVWDYFREFPGIVIDGTNRRSSELQLMDETLPTSYPVHGDIIIGKGSSH